ncbi:hypothetical protein AVEN_222785-1 [Araneus ventricosus]|uniref:Uncharacterized protein n=1 Tax=Araneus ventricosus TaxID=182803 RepID=A0A4Y2AZ08_ARAVE|nr:hypothetical protein AVEN_222785-1 [Araneus ventricosus]
MERGCYHRCRSCHLIMFKMTRPFFKYSLNKRDNISIREIPASRPEGLRFETRFLECSLSGPPAQKSNVEGQMLSHWCGTKVWRENSSSGVALVV